MKTLASCFLCLFFLHATPAVSDTLLIDVIESEPVNAEAGILRPTRGMNMAEVKARFGAATREHAGVGSPLITRWQYEDFSVYFEADIVLHSVLNKPALSAKE